MGKDIRGNYLDLLWNKATASTSTVNSGNLNIPQVAGATFILDIAAGTGTSPTCDVAIQVSPDGGTTYYTCARFAQVTTSAYKGYIRVRSAMGTADAGAAAAIADTGGAANANFHFTPVMRILATIGGTSPSFATIKVWMVAELAG